MTITNRLRERFCKDFRIPIRVFEEPYFSEKLKSFETTHNAVERYSRFLKTLEDFSNEEKYYEYYTSVKEAIIEYIKSDSKYEALNEIPVTKMTGKKEDIYSPNNLGKLYVSIDMKQANFSTLKYYGLFPEFKTYQDLVGHFTKYDHIVESKYIRQVVFGNCNCKRQMQLENNITAIVYNYLIKYIPEDKIVAICNDEIVVEADEAILETINKVMSSDECEEVKMYRATPFILRGMKYGDSMLGYVRIDPNTNEIHDFKCVEGEVASLLYNLYQDKEITESDLIIKSPTGFTATIIDFDKNLFTKV